MNPRTADVTLREITAETVRTICDLQVRPEQQAFVASNAVSIAQAHFEPKAWFRAIYAGEEAVGFVMLSLDEKTPEYYIWRFMIDARHQGRGYGRAALELAIDHIRGLPGAAEVLLSYVPAPGGPEAFYRQAGFQPTGQIIEGEVVMKRLL
jgi:diamine N-acetyltransferase